MAGREVKSFDPKQGLDHRLYKKNTEFQQIGGKCRMQIHPMRQNY